MEAIPIQTITEAKNLGVKTEGGNTHLHLGMVPLVLEIYSLENWMVAIHSYDPPCFPHVCFY